MKETQNMEKYGSLERTERPLDSIKDPVRFHPNRAQQILLAVAGMLLLLLAMVPPWKTVVDGATQLIGFYPVFGRDAQNALITGGMNVTVHVELMALMLGGLATGAGLLYGALALTREDWAALLTRYAQDAGAMHSAEVPGILMRIRDHVGDRVDALMDRVEFNFSRVRPVQIEGDVHPTSMQRHIFRRISDKIARGEIADAEALLLRVHGHAIKQYGEDDPFVDELEFRYANLLRDRGDLREAEELYHGCIARRETLYGEHDLRVATALQSYARLMLQMRRRVLARRLEALASSIRRRQHHIPVDALPVVGDSYISHDEILPGIALPENDDDSMQDVQRGPSRHRVSQRERLKN
jgi:hypothetical protein